MIPVEAVNRVNNLESLLALLHNELAWPVDPASAQEDYTFTWNADELRLDPCAAGRLCQGVVRQLRPFNPAQPWGIFLVEFQDGHIYRTALRQVLRGLVPSRRRTPGLPAWQHENLLFICTTGSYDRFTFAHFRGERAQKARLASFGWERGDEYVRTLCEYNLPPLAFPEDDGRDTAAWLTSWAKAFDKEPLTRRFFKCFENALEAVKADLEKYQKLPSAQAYSHAQLLLERLIFCYFLQNRGWLAQDHSFLIKHFETFRSRPDEFSYYADFLEKLFWSLASPPGGDAFRFADIPFLNGGLFDDDEFSPLRKKQNPPLKIRNATFTQVFSDLLEAFNFTVCEDTPLNQDVAVDPEMLGKVFESIVLHAEAADPDAVAPDKRKATGSYYTPRIVVHFICRETLLQWIKTQLPGPDWEKRLKALFDIDPTDGLQADELARLKDVITPAQGVQVARLIADLKCCDPAVGSGAFPVGLLHELVNLRRVCEAAANGYVDPVRKDGHEWLHKTKADVVENSLYGVDIQQQAIEICRLRLWLSLVVDYDLGVDPFTADRAAFRQAIGRISQLPNLEMNFHRGDSLHDHISGIPLVMDPGSTREYRKEMEAIRKMGLDLHRATKAQRKKELRIKILGARLDLTETVLKAELDKYQRFGGAGLMLPGLAEESSETEKHRRIAEEIAHVKQALAKVQADRKELAKLATSVGSDFYVRLRKLEGADFDSPFNFAWRLDLPAIFGRDPPGFDIIVGNPPFVTARNPEKRELYRRRWPLVCHREYELVSPFLQMSFSLLCTDGELGFIVSNGFAMRDFGKPLVERFFPSIHLQKIVDCDGLSFPGHGTPTCIVFGRQPSQAETPAILLSHRVIVAGRLPGGGDLRAMPEDSPLWSSLSLHHGDAGYRDDRIVVAEKSTAELAKWPLKFDTTGQSTRDVVEQQTKPLNDFIVACGSMFDTHKDDAYVLSEHVARRASIELGFLVPVVPGDQLRNWSVFDGDLVLKPYSESWDLLAEDKRSRLFRWLRMLKHELGGRATFAGSTYAEAGEPWFRYHQMSVAKITARLTLAYPEIATHAHFAPLERGRLLPQTAPVLQLPRDDEHLACLLAGLLNSSSVLFWLKQVSINKGASKDEHLDRFEYQGKRIKLIPVPLPLAEALGGKPNALAKQLMAMSLACWDQGRALPALSLHKLFVCDEAYHAWNSALPGWVAAAAECARSFSTKAELRSRLAAVIQRREQLRSGMIARQEEMDWLVYQAYGLCDSELTIEDYRLNETDLVLAREERPFCLWAQAEGDFDKAVALIPPAWSAGKKELWRRRLAAIRDNENIRRIEQPVYKRRWDEQWKVGNRWQCGQPAYDAEFLDAFSWWLSEKAEWHLEHVARGPMALDGWAAALWSDSRIQAAWTVAAEAIHRLEVWKESQKEHPAAVSPAPDAGLRAFERFLRDLVKDQAVPENIPFAVPWDDLEKQKVKVPASVKRIRGKLNVPRERFWLTADGRYRQAQPFGPQAKGGGSRE